MNCEYKRAEYKDYEYILNIVEDDKERVFFKDDINEDYSHDELGGIRKMPDIVVQPVSTEEVSKIMRYAYDNNIPVTPRGSGTGLVGAAVPLENGIVIDTSRMNKILELDQENLTLTLEPGVLLMDIGKYVEEADLFYPPDPGEKSATI